MVQIKIDGLEEILKKATPKILEKPMHNFFDRATIHIQGLGRRKAPVDTGRLRASIAQKVDPKPLPLWGEVGSNVFYAPYVEFGTGTMSDQGSRARHWPPSDALEGWAMRHGFPNAFLVARAIGRRGGLKARKFLRGAVEESRSKLQELLNIAAREIEQAWRS